MLDNGINEDEPSSLRQIVRDVQKDSQEMKNMLSSFITETRIHRDYMKQTLEEHGKFIDKEKQNKNKEKWIERGMQAGVASIISGLWHKFIG